MEIKYNPIAQAEEDFKKLLKDLPLDPETKIKVHAAASAIVADTVRREKFFIAPHDDCGADNPKGKVKLCNCACHKGHYRHYWDTEKPVMKIHKEKDNTFHIIERCKYCADTRLKIIKTEWVKEELKIVTMEYHIQGETRVLTKEFWAQKKPEDFSPEFKRQVNP